MACFTSSTSLIFSHEESSSLAQTSDSHLGRGPGCMVDEAKSPFFSRRQFSVALAVWGLALSCCCKTLWRNFPGRFFDKTLWRIFRLDSVFRRWLSHLLAGNRWKWLLWHPKKQWSSLFQLMEWFLLLLVVFPLYRSIVWIVLLSRVWNMGFRGKFRNDWIENEMIIIGKVRIFQTSRKMG